jgi:hypothetical protein
MPADLFARQPATPAAPQQQSAAPAGANNSSPASLVEADAPARPAGVRDTSMAAYRALQWSGKLGAQQQRITDYFLANPKMRFTRKELAHDLGMEINAVCGRVNELLAEPYNVLVEVGKKQCRITRNIVNALRLNEESK